MKHLAALLLLACAATALAAESRISHIPLDYRSAEEILPLLRPHLDETTRLSGSGGSLILQGDPETLARLERLVAELDSAPASLRISLRRGASLREDSRGFGAEGRIDSRQGAQGRVRIYRDSAAGSEEATQSVRGLDGRPVRIAQALSLPVRQRTVVVGRHGSGVEERVHYRELRDGFHALPRLQGERVQVDILVQQQSPRRQGGAEGMELLSSVSGELGEWLPLGAWDATESRRDGGRRLSTRQASRAQQRWWLRVERLPE